jgi:hypothetical protein
MSMKTQPAAEIIIGDGLFLAEQTSSTPALSSAMSPSIQSTMTRMFRDPYVLEPNERTELVEELTYLVASRPDLPEIRILLGMTLCVDSKPQEALEVLRIAVTMAPDSFLAQLKFGELLMRLRICDQAAEHTHQAALLAENPVQSELARRQAATIRGMRQGGVERGGYSGMLSRMIGLFKKLRVQKSGLEITATGPQ